MADSVLYLEALSCVLERVIDFVEKGLANLSREKSIFFARLSAAPIADASGNG